MNKQFYLALWRWHFFAGLYVVPFILMLSITGLIMLASPWTDAWQYGDELTLVDVDATNGSFKLSADDQLNTVNATYPNLIAAQYIPPIAANQSSIFKMRGKDFATLLVFVNPYNGEILGDFNSADRWYSIADNLHGTLMIGKVGDALIELSAGLMIFLLVSGLYLHWPSTRSGMASMLLPPFMSQLLRPSFLLPKNLSVLLYKKWKAGHKHRSVWKDLHSSLGFYLSLFILFFALTGMAWTGIWGQQLVQPFSSFPVEKRASNWRSDITHGQLNDGDLNEIPWNLEQVSMPQSTLPTYFKDEQEVQEISASKARIAVPISLDNIVKQGLTLGFQLSEDNRFRIALPLKPEGVYTLMSIASSRDVLNPMNDRTVHIDQYRADVLADIGWQNYNIVAKAMALGIPLHKGTLGLWNVLLAAMVCLLLIVLGISGFVLWWSRKPSGVFAAPKLGSLRKISRSAKTLIVMSVLLAICFPVLGIAMAIFAIVEFRLRSIK